MQFFEKVADLVPSLGYFMPALMARLPDGMAFDEQMKLFVVDMEEHDAFRRGRAVDRQDKLGVAGSVGHSVVEPAEEIRLLSCKTISTLISRVQLLGSQSILHPYFHEMVMFLQAQLRDSYPDLKVEALKALELLALEEEFVSGMKYFAVALVRAALPCLRNRLAKVRIAALGALQALIMVPDRAKRKGAGSDAITDLVGFREENVLQVAAFYKSEVQINYIAELVDDPSVSVREKLVDFLTALLTVLDDR